MERYLKIYFGLFFVADFGFFFDALRKPKKSFNVCVSRGKNASKTFPSLIKEIFCAFFFLSQKKEKIIDCVIH